jgi:hypothetical protein
MVCPRCSRENAEENRFCGRCGLDFSKVEPASEAPADARPCYRHPRELTNLSCGRCGKAICHRCVVIGPAGPRCRDCGTLKIPVSARAVAGEAKLGVRRLFSAGPYAIYWFFLIASLLFWTFRGCARMSEERDVPPGHERAAPVDTQPLEPGNQELPAK